MDCREVEGLLSEYACHALGQEEEALVEAHISSCPGCSALARQAEAATSALADAFPRIEPPSGLKARVLRQAQRERPLATRGGWSWRGLFASPALAASAAAMVLLLAAAVALSALSFVRAEGLRRDNSLLAAKLASTQQMLKQERSLAYMIATPGSKTVLLSGTEEYPQSHGMLMMDPKGERAYLVALGLDPAPEGRAYHAWLTKGDQRTFAGIFTVDELGWGVLVIRPSRPLTDFDYVGVTEESTGTRASSLSPWLLGAELATH